MSLGFQLSIGGDLPHTLTVWYGQLLHSIEGKADLKDRISNGRQ